jgi:hypothetical protein
MRCIVRPVAAFTARERRMLHWITPIAVANRVEPLKSEKRGQILILCSDRQLADDVALAAMAQLKRPFLYEVFAIGKPRGTREVVGAGSIVTGESRGSGSDCPASH